MFRKINVKLKLFFFALKIKTRISGRSARELNINRFIINIFVKRNRLFCKRVICYVILFDFKFVQSDQSQAPTVSIIQSHFKRSILYGEHEK